MSSVNVQFESITPNFGFDQKISRDIVSRLYRLFADEYLLSHNAKIFQLNVTGPRSDMLCDVFRNQACSLYCLAEKIGHYIRKEGARVPSIQESLKIVTVQVPPDNKWLDANSMLRKMLQDQEGVVRLLFKDVEEIKKFKEFAVEDTLNDVINEHKELCKKLRIHLENESPASQ